MCIWEWLMVMSLTQANLLASASLLVPSIYVFGDSTADVGTNNFLPKCGAKANFPPYGIDYPGSKPTGRFSNGYNAIDIIAQFIGFKESPPPFLYLLNNDKSNFRRNVLMGANFASGGAGLLNDTGKRTYGRVIPISEQIRQFKTIRDIHVRLLGSAAAEERISKSLFLFSVGSNDIFEHFLYNQRKSSDPKKFINHLLYVYENHLKNLMSLGARRFGVMGISPLGCCPIQRVLSGNGGCLEAMNTYAQMFEDGLEVTLRKLSVHGVRMTYAYAKLYKSTYNIINYPRIFSFRDSKTACCGKGNIYNAEKPCKPDSNLCENRKQNIFWDQFHPTEASYKLAALALFGGGINHVTPMNLNRIISPSKN
ncbi:hypothetical protein UlMin_039673 [Ulmus minor]